MSDNLELVPTGTGAVTKPAPSAIDILQAAVAGGITSENVAVVQQIREMVREEETHKAKLAFGRAFFALRREMPIVYADKEVRTESGAMAFRYCSPEEIKNVLEPLMHKHGFATMTTQTMDGETKVTVVVTLIHEQGHQVQGTFTLRVGQENRLVKGPQVVAGATTAAERHCLIKLFGLRTRIDPTADARNEGEAITEDQAKELQRRVMETESNETAFLKFCGVPVNGKAGPADYQRIMSSRYPAADDMLRKKEQRGR